jgi:hypothetical protein
MSVRSSHIRFFLFFLLLLHLTGCGSSDPFPALPAPTITSLSPTNQVTGSPDFTLTVNGSGFLSVSEVNFDNIPVTTTFVSESQLDAEIPASFINFSGITAPVTVPVTVDNPAAAGGVSSPASFTVTP